MGMDMRCAILNGVINAHVSLKTLMQIAGLRNEDRNPTPILGLFGVNEITGRRLERSVYGINRVLILFSRLAGPVDQVRRRALRGPVTTEQMLYEVHRVQIRT